MENELCTSLIGICDHSSIQLQLGAEKFIDGTFFDMVVNHGHNISRRFAYPYNLCGRCPFIIFEKFSELIGARYYTNYITIGVKSQLVNTNYSIILS